MKSGDAQWNAQKNTTDNMDWFRIRIFTVFTVQNISRNEKYKKIYKKQYKNTKYETI